ncbi:uncharacterized protein vgf isoform X2 [Festucalex cinctus]
MMGSHVTPSALLLLVLLTWPSSADPTAAPDIPTEMAQGGDEDPIPKTAAKEGDLFDDVDPKTLAALLLGALNHTRADSRRENDDDGVAAGEPEGKERDRDGRLKLELLMAAQGREERKKAEEEEERMTERVSSRTTSQTVQVQTQPPPPEQGGEEEQLNPEELKSLETMMKEFPRLDSAVKRAGDLEQREIRAYSSYNDIIPFNKGNNVALSKKKLKWQEETQKALNIPSFRGNFMDDFKDVGDTNTEEEEEEEEEALSPEEEEARAKAEQEEMRRQAAEVQRAKLEEEKLADIASDMLLRYMVKQNGGGRKYVSPNAAEDKRSEEDLQGEDDIDPQTIDKLIEISSKLHLPADDVVDIISDVEKKKKKDATPQMPVSSSAGSFLESKDGPISSKQPSPALHLLKNWFQEQSPTRSKEFWSNPVSKPYMWPKAPKPMKQNPWGWTRYPYMPFYPVHFPPPRATYRYYVPKPTLALNGFLQRSRDGAAAFQSKQRYLNWVQPRLRKPPATLQRKPYYPRYQLSLYPQRPLAAPRVPQFYQSPAKEYLSDSKGQLEKYIEQLLMKRPRLYD